MSVDYQKAWDTMNSLEQMSTKILAAHEMLDVARHSLENRKYERIEALISATQDFIEYYLKEFDEKFRAAWTETVVAAKEDGFYWDTDPKENLVDWLANPHLTEDRIDNFPVDCDKSPWVDCPDGFEASTKKKWTLLVEAISNGDSGEPDYFITLPDDLLEQVGWTEGTELNWGDNGDGSYTLTKVSNPKTYDDMIKAGYTMTDDGFWIKE